MSPLVLDWKCSFHSPQSVSDHTMFVIIFVADRIENVTNHPRPSSVEDEPPVKSFYLKSHWVQLYLFDYASSRCAQGCKEGPCSNQFSEETVLSNLNNCLELSSGELDLVILANVQVFISIKCIGEKRTRSSRCSFYFQSRPICKEMFLHLYGISYSRFLRLKEHYGKHGITPRIHGHANRVPSNASPHSTVTDVHAFLVNYVEENAIMLPGRIPGYKSDDVKILSSSETKTSVWKVYSSMCKASNKQAISYKKFTWLW